MKVKCVLKTDLLDSDLTLKIGTLDFLVIVMENLGLFCAEKLNKNCGLLFVG